MANIPGEPLTEEERLRLREIIRNQGRTKTYRAIGISETAMHSALSGVPIASQNLTAVRGYLSVPR